MSDEWNALDFMRDEVLRTCARPEDARAGAARLREIAFARWCPPCQRGDHWNHATTTEEPRCNSFDNISSRYCTCFWRVERPTGDVQSTPATEEVG